MTHDDSKKAKTGLKTPTPLATFTDSNTGGEFHFFEPEGEEPDLIIGEGSYGDDEAFDEVEVSSGEIPSRGFSLGRIFLTPGAIDAISDAKDTPGAFLLRHLRGDWGEVCAEDAEENELSLKEGFRLMSVYRTTKGVKLWVITEWDRSLTTILLPEEY